MTHRFLSSCSVDVIYAVNGQTYAVAEVAGFTLNSQGTSWRNGLQMEW